MFARAGDIAPFTLYRFPTLLLAGELQNMTVLSGRL